MQLTVGYIALSYLLYSLEKERQGYEESLVRTVNDKEILLKEVHHRTKNNMQIMMALLDTQALKIEDAKYKKMFQTHVDRLKAMALVHENLYRGESYETVEIDRYLKEITEHLQKLTTHTIDIDIEKIVLTMKTAMNLGLVYNEALSNAIAHAYKKGQKGKIEVSLKREGEQCVLTIHDDGMGFDIDKEHKTLGMTLMQDISHSLEGDTLEIYSDEGTTVKVYCAISKEHS